MDKDYKPKSLILILAIVLAPFFSGCTGAFKGYVKDASTTPLTDTRVTFKSTSLQQITCSQTNGYYNYDIPAGSYTISYRKKGFKVFKLENQIARDLFPTPVDDVSLQSTTAGKEISGQVYISSSSPRQGREGVTVNLYQISCGAPGPTPIDSAVTCSDGYYTFSVLPDGSELPDNTTYKVEPVCAGVCTFSPQYRDGIAVPVNPSSQTFDFAAACGSGACP